jgi:AcrR family transcriptional regulator
MATAKSQEPPASERQETIRDAATTLFDLRGYHGTRMKDIGEHLGIQAPSLYNHVTSKQALLHDIMFSYMSGILREHELAIESTPSVVEKLRRAMEAHVRYCSRHPRETRIGGREVPSLSEPARDELLAMRKKYASDWKDLLDQGVAEGEFVVARTQLAANALLQMGVGVALWLRQLPLSESELVYTLAEMALRSVGVQNPSTPLQPAASSAGAD